MKKKNLGKKILSNRSGFGKGVNFQISS